MKDNANFKMSMFHYLDGIFLLKCGIVNSSKIADEERVTYKIQRLVLLVC